MFSFRAILWFSVVCGICNGSAIPMWEYLSKQEKMSYLMYSCFTTQVEKYCKQHQEMTNCNKDLLKYGLNTLRTLSEEDLDTLDPYQRGANEMIWESLLKGHKLVKDAPRQEITTSTAKPNSYDDESFGDFAEQGLASARIDNVYIVAPPKDFVPKLESDNAEYAFSNGPSLNSFNPLRRRQGNIFRRFQNQYRPVAVTTEKIVRNNEEYHLSGPIEYRVRFDGTPVREASTEVPVDEDLRQYRLSKRRLPTF